MDYAEIKKKYTWLGISFAVFGIVMQAVSLVMELLLKNVDSKIFDNSWVVYILGLMPIWAIGFPACLLVASKIPSKKPEEHDMKLFDLAQVYCMVTFFAIVMNLVGLVIISGLEKITGLTLQNTTIDLVSKQDVLPTIIFAVILGPIMEELAYRKLLIDKIGQYDKVYAIVLSGLMFGLFHTNIYQFFYTVCIGMLFAYVYTKTGKIRYSMILHMCMNFVHGAVPVILSKYLDMELITSLSGANLNDPDVQKKVTDMYTNPGFLLYLGYANLILVLVILGFVVFLIWNIHKKWALDNSESMLPEKGASKIVFGNLGFILFTLVTIGITIYEIVLLQ